MEAVLGDDALLEALRTAANALEMREPSPPPSPPPGSPPGASAVPVGPAPSHVLFPQLPLQPNMTLAPALSMHFLHVLRTFSLAVHDKIDDVPLSISADSRQLFAATLRWWMRESQDPTHRRRLCFVYQLLLPWACKLHQCREKLRRGMGKEKEKEAEKEGGGGDGGDGGGVPSLQSLSLYTLMTSHPFDMQRWRIMGVPRVLMQGMLDMEADLCRLHLLVLRIRFYNRTFALQANARLEQYMDKIASKCRYRGMDKEVAANLALLEQDRLRRLGLARHSGDEHDAEEEAQAGRDALDAAMQDEADVIVEAHMEEMRKLQEALYHERNRSSELLRQRIETRKMKRLVMRLWKPDCATFAVNPALRAVLSFSEAKAVFQHQRSLQLEDAQQQQQQQPVAEGGSPP